MTHCCEEAVRAREKSRRKRPYGSSPTAHFLEVTEFSENGGNLSALLGRNVYLYTPIQLNFLLRFNSHTIEFRI